MVPVYFYFLYKSHTQKTPSLFFIKKTVQDIIFEKIFFSCFFHYLSNGIGYNMIGSIFRKSCTAYLKKCLPQPAILILMPTSAILVKTILSFLLFVTKRHDIIQGHDCFICKKLSQNTEFKYIKSFEIFKKLSKLQLVQVSNMWLCLH